MIGQESFVLINDSVNWGCGFEVIARNSFGIMASNGWDDTGSTLGLGPTVFAYDISRMISGVLFMGAAGYGLMRGVHIRADFCTEIGPIDASYGRCAALYAIFYTFYDFYNHCSSILTSIATGETAFDSPWELFCGPLDWQCRGIFFCYYRVFLNSSSLP